jgi:predicted amidophosphoribosyltransferase
MTTGATIGSCAGLLLSAGIDKVSLATLAIA